MCVCMLLYECEYKCERVYSLMCLKVHMEVRLVQEIILDSPPLPTDLCIEARCLNQTQNSLILLVLLAKLLMGSSLCLCGIYMSF